MHLDYPESLVSPSTFKLHSGDAMGEVTTIRYVAPVGSLFPSCLVLAVAKGIILLRFISRGKYRTVDY